VQPWKNRVVRIRINSESIRVALRAKILLERALERKFELAVSSRNFIMLDCDRKDKRDEFISFCAGIVKEFGGRGHIYETPHGYHFFLERFLTHQRWLWFYRTLAKELRQKPRLQAIIDLNHVEAVLRRGYTTLRLNQIRKIAVISSDGEVKYLV